MKFIFVLLELFGIDFQRSKVKKILIALLASMGLSTAYASHCTVGEVSSQTGWFLFQDLSNITNGRVIGSNVFSFPVEIYDVAQGDGLSLVGYMIRDINSGEAVPLSTVPGLSIRWAWGRYNSEVDANLSPAPPGVTFMHREGVEIFRSKFTEAASYRRARFTWTFELIVTDVKAYAGGYADLSRENLGMTVVPFMNLNDQNVACIPSFIQFTNDLRPGGVLALPELPKPPTPTCQFPFHSYTQNVNLPSTPSMLIAGQQEPREKGVYSQTQFVLNAQNCGADTKFEMYFTDNHLPGEVKDYLVTQGNAQDAVGIRLYAGSSPTPVVFGPAPSGSTMSVHPPAIVEGPTVEGSNFSYPITAQYVRLPGVAGNEVPTGNVAAQAVVTVIYP